MALPHLLSCVGIVIGIGLSGNIFELSAALARAMYEAKSFIFYLKTS